MEVVPSSTSSANRVLNLFAQREIAVTFRYR
jgi:hypothetical protein